MKADREAVDTDAVNQLSTGGERVVLQITPSGADEGACTVGQVKGKMPSAGARDRDGCLRSLDRTHGNEGQNLFFGHVIFHLQLGFAELYDVFLFL